MLNTKEFNKLTEKIAESLYRLNSDVRDLYDIHINYIQDTWQIDFIPLMDKIPTIKVDTFVKQDNDGAEILKIIPKNLSGIPDRIKFTDASGYDLCMNYIELFEFVILLYDFEYVLN